MRALRICLLITGLICMLGLFGLIAPINLLESLTNRFGTMEFPKSPVMAYSIRGISATYVAIGVFYLILAYRPREYWRLIPVSGLALIWVALCCLIAGVVTGIPRGWFLGDFLTCTILGILICVFWCRLHGKKQLTP